MIVVVVLDCGGGKAQRRVQSHGETGEGAD